MNSLYIAVLLIGVMKPTAYRSVTAQTDDSPFYTSTGEHVSCHGVAVSQDLLAKNGGPLRYGDLLYVEGVGFKFVNDCMARKNRQAIDIWVSSKAEEHEFWHRFKNKKVRVWIVSPVQLDVR